MKIFLFSLLFVSLVNSQSSQDSRQILEQKYNETERIAQFKELFGIPLPTIKIPDLLNPEVVVPPIKSLIPSGKLPGIALPTLPHLLPTALPQIKLPTIKIPDLIPTALPTIKIPEIPKILPTLPPIQLPTIKIPDLIPTALPTIKIPEIPKITLPPIHIPTIKIPTLPHILPTALPTLPPIHIPTIKIPTLPHILPTALPTLFPRPPAQKATPNTPYTLPYPLPSDMSPIPFLNNNTDSNNNLICDLCENAVTVVKSRFQLFEKVIRNKLGDILTNVCSIIGKFEPISILSAPCLMFKSNLIDQAFKKLDDFEATITPKGVCRILPFCR